VSDDLFSLQRDLDRCADLLILRVTERATNAEALRDWRDYFTEARKHPGDPWLARVTTESLISTLTKP